LLPYRSESLVFTPWLIVQVYKRLHLHTDHEEIFTGILTVGYGIKKYRWYTRGRYKTRTGSTQTASPVQINSDQLGSSRIMKKTIKLNEIETFTHLKVKIPVKSGPN